MVLNREELTFMVREEARVLLHLLSKIEPSMLEYRPTDKQRSLLELTRYLATFGPANLYGATADQFSMDSWRENWNREQSRVAEMDLDGLKSAIAEFPDAFEARVKEISDEQLRETIEVFGSRASRGAWLVRLLVQHYAAYKMQLFLYLKSAGREELNTFNLWMGVDGQM